MQDTADSVRRRGGRSKGDEREQQILSATRALLAERSMAAVTIDDITAAAGISRTSFYFYFPSKQAVLTRLMEQVGTDFAETHTWFASEGPSREALREQMHASAVIWTSNAPIMACTIARGFDYPPLEEFLKRTDRRFIDGLAAKIARDQDAGLAPTGIAPAELASMVARVRDVRLAELGSESGAALDRAVDTLVEIIVRMIYATASPPAR